MTDDDTTTKSTKTRWEHTGTFAAILLVTTVCVVLLISVYRGTEAPLWATGTFGLSTLAAVAWVFGESALRAARKSSEN